MTDDDAEALYGRVEEALIASGFSWIVEQVADYVRGGRLEPVQIRSRANTVPFVETIQGGWQEGADKANRYIRSVPFTVVERLDILLEAVSEVTLEFPAMLSRAASGITADSGLVSIALVDESGQRIDVTAESRIARSQELDHLVTVIAHTRAELP